MNSSIFKLNWADLRKGLIVAVLSGVALPVLAMVQTQGFDITQANWHAVFILALNGGVAGLSSYLIKNFLSDNQGRVFGRIG